MNTNNAVMINPFAQNVFNANICMVSSAALFHETFQLNRQIFGKLKNRTCFIREQAQFEFDAQIVDGIPGMETITGMYSQRPRLFVFVSGDATYQINMPCYRSGPFDAFFPTEKVCGVEIAKATNDQAVMLVLVEMQMRHGLESVEFTRFLASWRKEWDKLNSKAAQAEQGTPVDWKH